VGDELVGTAEIADRLGLAHSTTVHSWRNRYPDFPQPVSRIGPAYVWRWSDIEAWARATGRLG